MKINKIATCAVLAFGLTGCATIVKGTSQNITVNTNPQRAACLIERDGNTLANIPSTPQVVKISKSHKDLTVTCRKKGYQTAIHQIPSSVEAMTLGNVLIGGVIGVAVDAGTGALNKYNANVTITLTPPGS